MAARKKPTPVTEALPLAAPPAPRLRIGEPARSPEPLRITAVLRGQIALPTGPMSIDGLLAWAVCAREGIPPMMRFEEAADVQIPVVRAPGGRFHLASFSLGIWERFSTQWTNRRFPLHEAECLGAPSVRRVLISGGPCKTYRIPREVGHLIGDRLTWYVLGDRGPIEELLDVPGHLGKRRAVGLGPVLRWYVEPCETWEGFPVVSPDGAALRPLPLDWPGLVNPLAAMKTLSFPYADKTREEAVAAPARMARCALPSRAKTLFAGLYGAAFTLPEAVPA